MLCLVVGIYELSHLSGKTILRLKKVNIISKTEFLKRKHRDKISYHPPSYIFSGLAVSKTKTL